MPWAIELHDIELVWGSANNEAGEGDTFIASAGVDLIHGDLGSDTVSYEASSTRVIVILSDDFDDDSPGTAMPADAVITTRTATNGVGLPDEDLAPAVLMYSAVADDGEFNRNHGCGNEYQRRSRRQTGRY